MPMSIQEMREARNAKAREYRNILDKHPEDKALPEEAGKALDALMVEIDALEDRINREQKALDMAADELAENKLGESVAKVIHDDPNGSKALFAKWLKGGPEALTREEWKEIRNTMSTGTPEQGGYTVQTDVAKTVLEALKEFGGMREAATTIQTAQGNPINWPTSDGTSEEGEIVAENQQVGAQDVSFGMIELPVFKYSSKTVVVPWELIQDSEVDIEAFINRRIVQRLGRITNRHFTVGTGVKQPKGIIAAADVGVTGASGQVDTISYNDLVNLEHSVDPAYRAQGGARFMFHDQTLRLLKQLKDQTGRPLWMPDIIGSAPAMLLGYGYTINQNMAPMAANAKSVAFGKLSEYVIRDVMAVTYRRFDDSKYAEKGQVGFLAFMRSGGNLMDVGGAVKLYQNAAS